eukprot:8758352-Alexandrium_andersonii.AAC.1
MDPPGTCSRICLWLPSIPIREPPQFFEALEVGAARIQGRPQHCPPKLPRGACCAVVRAEAESANETGRREHQRRFSGG